MTSKIAEFKSGTTITRTYENDYDEVWDIECKAVAITYITLDLSGCSGWEVDGHKGEDSVTEVCQPMESKRLFYIAKYKM